MKSGNKMRTLTESFESLKKLFTSEKLLCEIFDMMDSMTHALVDKLIQKKR